jgi:hypothetical protein
VPFQANDRFRAEAHDVADLERRDAGSRKMPRWLGERGGRVEDYRFYLFGTRYEYVFLAYGARTDELVGVLDIDALHIPPITGAG